MPPTSFRPIDATLSVTKAARLLGVHPNTVRAWSDEGRLRHYRINSRGDRRYRIGDLQRFLAAAGREPVPAPGDPRPGRPLARGPRPPSQSPRAPEPSAHARPPDAAVPVDAAGAPVSPLARHVAVLGELAALPVRVLGHDRLGADELVEEAVRVLHRGLELGVAACWQQDDGGLVLRAASGPGRSRLTARGQLDGTVVEQAAAMGGASNRLPVEGSAAERPVVAGLGPEVAAVVPVHGGAWGVLFLAGPAAGRTPETVAAAARAIGAAIELADTGRLLAIEAHRANALRRIAGDLGSRLELDQILAAVVDHAVDLFEADRAALALHGPDDGFATVATRGLSRRWAHLAADVRPRSLAAAAIAERQPIAAPSFVHDPRSAEVREAVIAEGFQTLCVAPLLVGSEVLGLLTVYHDRPHDWTPAELETVAAFAAHSSVAIRTARNYSQMATWTAQLGSIQQLGARLSRHTTVRGIGMAIATELRELIDYHNVRVYRRYGEDLIPVAMRGQVGVYVDETPEQLRVRVGQGITGWVAEHRQPESLPDAAGDPRANTIPGTEEDLDESMLLAPMLFDDEVLGVLVLSKLGLGQFTDDDLRLLVIYASFAAQAMANADATEQLRRQTEAVERQARGQRELLRITESILTTLDPRDVLDEIADRLGELVHYDNISIEVYDPAARLLRPLTARGVNAAEYLEPWAVGETGIATWVIEHNEPVLVVDQFDDPRVAPFESTGPIHGGLVVVPLRGRDGVTGVLTLERVGEGATFSDEEFELVKLFAGHVSIALQNAEIYGAVAARARTDGLTGLLNHATFRERLVAAVSRGERFSLVMMDLDSFKTVNDALGHQAGDRLLAEIAQAVASAGRDSDQVFRYGGDEFTMLLAGVDAGAARAVAERVRSAVRGVGGPGSRWQREGIRVSASLGVATFPDDASTAESMLLAADRACFVGKRTGPGRVATAEEGLALAAEFSLQEPTPVDSPSAPAA